jgi:hypothetical protein
LRLPEAADARPGSVHARFSRNSSGWRRVVPRIEHANDRHVRGTGSWRETAGAWQWQGQLWMIVSALLCGFVAAMLFAAAERGAAKAAWVTAALLTASPDARSLGRANRALRIPN